MSSNQAGKPNGERRKLEGLLFVVKMETVIVVETTPFELIRPTKPYDPTVMQLTSGSFSRKEVHA